MSLAESQTPIPLIGLVTDDERRAALQSAWDVIVVGAGPGGCAAARFAAEDGARVLLLERQREVGRPVQCAEHVCTPVLAYLPHPEAVVVQGVEAMRSHVSGMQSVTTSSPGVIVDRALFDRQLAQAAVDAGAILLTGISVVGLGDDCNGTFVRICGRGVSKNDVRAHVIIGADGPRSKVRRLSGPDDSAYLRTLQVQMPLRGGLSTSECYFREYIPGGYGWVFPKGEWANVGIGLELVHGVLPQDALARFVAELIAAGVVIEQRRCQTAGLIPVAGLERLRRGRVLLVGDAGGFCHPITGAGIGNAILSGELAGAAAAEAAKAAAAKNTLAVDAAMDEYVLEATEMLGPALSHAVAKRRLLSTPFSGFDDWRTRTRDTWVAFDEYQDRETEDASFATCG